MDLQISLLDFNFIMIHIIHKILVLIKNHINFIDYERYFYFFKKIIFKRLCQWSQTIWHIKNLYTNNN